MSINSPNDPPSSSGLGNTTKTTNTFKREANRPNSTSILNERRLLQRTNLALYLNVRDNKSNQPLGNIIDINVCGLLLLSKQPLNIGAAYNIKIELPKDVSHQEDVLFNAEVRRCAKSCNPSFWEAGLEIIHIDSTNQKRIEDLEHSLLLKFHDD